MSESHFELLNFSESRFYLNLSTTEFEYLRMLGSNPIIQETNPTLFYFAHSLAQRAYRHVQKIFDFSGEYRHGKLFLLCF